MAKTCSFTKFVPFFCPLRHEIAIISKIYPSLLPMFWMLMTFSWISIGNKLLFFNWIMTDINYLKTHYYHILINWRDPEGDSFEDEHDISQHLTQTHLTLKILFCIFIPCFCILITLLCMRMQTDWIFLQFQLEERYINHSKICYLHRVLTRYFAWIKSWAEGSGFPKWTRHPSAPSSNP